MKLNGNEWALWAEGMREKKSFECKKNMKLKEKKVNYGVDQFSPNEWSLKEENVEGRRWMEKET